MMHWTNKYIGKPFDRVSMNCATLVENVYRNELNCKLKLPSIADYTPEGLNMTLSLHFQDYCKQSHRQPEDYDIVLMRSWKFYNHLGVCCIIDKCVSILHSFAGARQVVITPVNRLSMYELSVVGFYICR